MGKEEVTTDVHIEFPNTTSHNGINRLMIMPIYIHNLVYSTYPITHRLHLVCVRNHM